MSIGLKGRGRGVRQWAARILVVLFALRALVPAGFMPDVSAAGDGGVRLVICTAQGLATITIPVDGGTHAPSQDGTPETCPFGTMPVASDLPSTPSAPVAIAFDPFELAVAEVAKPVPRRIGPALGSRGPPSA